MWQFPDALRGEVRDFAKYEPGSTGLETLRQRFEALQAAGREMSQAKGAFEEAKAAQDADKVGRTLTYAEGRLKKRPHACPGLVLPPLSG